MVHTVYFSNMESLPELGLIISICSQIRIIFFPLQIKIVHIYVCLLCMLVIIFVLWSPSVYFPKTSRTSPHYPRDQTHTFICSPGMLKRWKFGCTFSSPPCGGLCWLLLWPWFYFRVIFRQNQSRLVPACASQLLPNNWLVWSQVTVPGFNAIKLPPKNFQSPTSNTSRRGEIVGRPRSFFSRRIHHHPKRTSTWPPTASHCWPPLPFDVLTRSVVLKHLKDFENIWIGDGSNGRLGRARSTHLQICKWLMVMKIIDDHWSQTDFTNNWWWWRCSMNPDQYYADSYCILRFHFKKHMIFHCC